MKKIIFSSIKGVFIAVAAIMIVSLSSCLDRDRYYYDVQVAGIALVNAAPGSPDLNLIGDNQREQLPAKFAYDSAIAYLPAYPGFRVFGFTKAGSYSMIVSQQMYLHPSYAYSIFIADTLGAAKMFNFRDSLRLPDTTKAAIRFINMSPDSKGLNFVNGTNTLVSNIAFGNASNFITIDPTTNGSFQIKENGSNATLATISSVAIAKGQMVTIWARGFENKNVADSLQIGLQQMRNK